jgi:hypothetical protein
MRLPFRNPLSLGVSCTAATPLLQPFAVTTAQLRKLVALALARSCLSVKGTNHPFSSNSQRSHHCLPQYPRAIQLTRTGRDLFSSYRFFYSFAYISQFATLGTCSAAASARHFLSFRSAGISGFESDGLHRSPDIGPARVLTLCPS